MSTTTLDPTYTPPAPFDAAVSQPPRYASVGERLGSSLVDCTLTVALCIPVFRAEGHSRVATFAWLGVVWIAWYAYIYVCYRRWGQTLGKWMFRIRLVSAADYGPVSARQILARVSAFIVVALLMLPGYWVALGRMHSAGWADTGWLERQAIVEELTPAWGDIVMSGYWLLIAACTVAILVSPRKQSLHDMIGGTVVIALRAREPVVYTIPMGRRYRFMAVVDWTLTVLLALVAGFFLVAALGAKITTDPATAAEMQAVVTPLLFAAAVVAVLAVLMANAALSLRSGNVRRRRGAHVLAYAFMFIPVALVILGLYLDQRS